MKLIVAVDKNWGIGKNNGLLFDLKLDTLSLQHKAQTPLPTSMGVLGITLMTGAPFAALDTSDILTPAAIVIKSLSLTFSHSERRGRTSGNCCGFTHSKTQFAKLTASCKDDAMIAPFCAKLCIFSGERSKRIMSFQPI